MVEDAVQTLELPSRRDVPDHSQPARERALEEWRGNAREVPIHARGPVPQGRPSDRRVVELPHEREENLAEDEQQGRAPRADA